MKHLQYPSTSSQHLHDVLVTRREGYLTFSLSTIRGWIMELWEDLQGFLCLGFGSDHRHQHLTLDVLRTTRRLFMLSIAKVTDERSFLSIGNVTFLHIPSSSCVFLSGFSAAYMNAASPPTSIHRVLGTLNSPVKSLQRSDFIFGFHPSSFTCLPKGSVSPQSRS